jgi:hypothetical protein
MLIPIQSRPKSQSLPYREVSAFDIEDSMVSMLGKEDPNKRKDLFMQPGALLIERWLPIVLRVQDFGDTHQAIYLNNTGVLKQPISPSVACRRICLALWARKETIVHDV